MTLEIKIVISIFYMICGLCIGSFVNVLIYRLPRNINVAFPPSSCPACDSKIKWYDNIPILSFILLKGRCRSCKEKISPIYPLVEAVNVILWGLNLVLFGLGARCIVSALASSALIAIFLIDAKYGIIPDSLNLFIGLLGISSFFIKGCEISAMQRLAGGAVGCVFFLILYLAFKILAKKEALGFGDVKFIASTGLLVGFRGTILTVFLSSILALIYIIARVLINKPIKDEFPFAPFLTIGTQTTLLFGDRIISLYLSILGL